MSNFSCPVVQLGKCAKHPNADSLSITHIGEYPVIFKSTEFKEGDLAVYVPEEALVPDDSFWNFMWVNRTNDGKAPREIDRVVKAKRLRGIFSCGLIVKPPFLPSLKNSIPGTDLKEAFGITKYEPAEQLGSGGDNDPLPSWLPKFTDIENARGLIFRQGRLWRAAYWLCRRLRIRSRWLGVSRATKLVPGEQVVITEKVHGANARFAVRDDKFYIGSHTNVKKHDSRNWWTHVAKTMDLEAKCRKVNELIGGPAVLFGEVYGQVQKGYDYGLKAPSFVLFDVYSLNDRKYLNWSAVVWIANELQIPLVPTLYMGPWVSLEHAMEYSDGCSILGGKSNREGCVIRTDPERRDEVIGRMALKLLGETYLLKKYS